MAQVTRFECDQCGKSAALDKVGDWWNVQTARRERDVSSQLTQMDQQLLAQAGGNPGMLNIPPGFNMPTGAPTMPPTSAVSLVPEEPFGSPKSVDVCSPKCALDFVREVTKEPPKKEATKADKDAARRAQAVETD